MYISFHIQPYTICQRSNFIFKIDKIFNYIIIKVHSYTTLKMLYLFELIIVKRKRVFINFFVTRNAWGAFSLNSHINQHTGKPKVMYNTVKSAQKSAEAMGKKHNTHFSYYKCLFCDGYHIGKNRDNKTDYDKQ